MTTDAAIPQRGNALTSRTPFSDAGQRFLAGRFGVWLFLASLGMLFGATLIAFLVLRLQIGKAWPDLPPLPRIMAVSTIVIIFSSMTMQRGVTAIRSGDTRSLSLSMVLTSLLGVAFLALQAIAWLQWLPAAVERWDTSNEWRFALTAFYVFTVLHAAHVVGGLIPLAVVTWRSFAGRYTAQRHAGVQFTAMYWHFLDAVWIALYASMLIGV